MLSQTTEHSPCDSDFDSSQPASQTTEYSPCDSDEPIPVASLGELGLKPLNIHPAIQTDAVILTLRGFVVSNH